MGTQIGAKLLTTLLFINLTLTGIGFTTPTAHATTQGVTTTHTTLTVQAHHTGVHNTTPLTQRVLVKGGGGSADSITNIGGGDALAGAVVNAINNNPNSTLPPILVYNSGGTLSFKNGVYSRFTLEEKREWMAYALETVKKSGLNARTKSKVYNFIAEQDGTVSAAIRQLDTDAQADIAKAGAVFSYAQNPISTGLGVLVLTIFMFLTLSIVVDLAWMVIPWFQSFGRDEEKPKLISPVAWQAIHRGGDKQDYLFFYLKKRSVHIIILGIFMTLLVTGRIWPLMAWFITSVSGGIVS